MGNTLYICNEDISKNTKATASALADAGTQITIGDLHGSTIKLLFVLAKHGFVTFTDEQYRELHTIYMIDQPIFENFMRFNEILHSLKFNKTNAVLRLIGDDLADRGQCDWLTINVIAVMRLRGIKLEILASNHGMDFMLASECDNAYQPYLLSEDTSSSMVKLHQLIKNGVLNENDVKKYLDIAYKPILKALSYTLTPDKKGITIFTHAPAGINTIAALAHKFGVPFNDKTPEKLAQTIDHINIIFAGHVRSNTLHKIVDKSALFTGYENIDTINMEKFPLEFLIWNRNYDVIERPNQHLTHGYSIEYCHGHDSQDRLQERHIFNIDNYLSKLPEDNEGLYSALFSKQIQLQYIPNMQCLEPITLSRPEPKGPNSSPKFQLPRSTPIKIEMPDEELDNSTESISTSYQALGTTVLFKKVVHKQVMTFSGRPFSSAPK